MTALRRPKGAVSLGDAVPCVHQAPATIARYCACGTRLRRGNPGPLCAQCHTRQHPWVMPEPYKPRPTDALTCPECGGYKKAESKRCRRCREGDPVTGYRRTCECGRLARRGRRRCSHCDRQFRTRVTAENPTL